MGTSQMDKWHMHLDTKFGSNQRRQMSTPLSGQDLVIFYAMSAQPRRRRADILGSLKHKVDRDRVPTISSNEKLRRRACGNHPVRTT